MAGRVDIQFNSAGFREILLSDGVYSVVQTETERIRGRANGNLKGGSAGYSAQVRVGNYGGGRWIGHVTTTDGASIRAEAEDKALTRAVK